MLASCDDDMRFWNNGDRDDDDDGLSRLPCALASCNDDMRFWNNGDHDDDDDGLSRLPCAKSPPSSRSPNRLGVFALSQVQSGPVASKKVARSSESLHASRLNIVTTKRLARSWVHYVLIFLCVILAARVIQLGVMKSDADGPHVSGMGLIVINVFSDVKILRSIVAIKGVFQTPVFDGDPKFAANSCIGIKLLCHSAAHE